CLYLYDHRHSGPALKVFDFNENNNLNLADTFAGTWRAVDVEAAVRSIKNPALSYWIGSMSNSSVFSDRPNRNRLFAVEISGKGKDTRITNQGYYSNLRQHL